MNILFLCGSLEPGKDGVGDYTRRLAGELTRQGHIVSIVAWNDRHITTVEQAEQASDGTKIPVLRLPTVWSNKEKRGKAGVFIKDFRPDWVSLQYVPYAYSKYGLAWSVLPLRKTMIGQGAKFCVTVHEPFVRVDDSKNPAHILIAILQRIILRKILRPACFVMTSIAHYGRLLDTYNQRIVINRIPPNIPPVSVPPEVLKEKRKEILEKMNVSKLIVIFGDRNTGSVIEAVERMNQNSRDKAGVLMVGKTRTVSNRPFVHHTGILPEAGVSVHLQMADLFVLPERVYKNNRGGASFKSGALAAALATPLPVMTSLGDMTETPPLIHGENVWFTDFDIDKHLESDLLLLLNNSDLLSRLRYGALQVYKEFLDWNIITVGYLEMLSRDSTNKC